MDGNVAALAEKQHGSLVALGLGRDVDSNVAISLKWIIIVTSEATFTLKSTVIQLKFIRRYIFIFVSRIRASSTVLAESMRNFTEMSL